MNMRENNAVWFVGLVFLLVPFQIRTEVFPESTEAALKSVAARMKSGEADTRVTARLLDLISVAPETRRAFIEMVMEGATPREILELKERIGQLRRDLPSSPVSYGFAGSFRVAAAVGLMVNARLMMHGFYSNPDFVDPGSRPDWAMISGQVDRLFVLGLARAGFKDLQVFRRERPLQKEHREMLRRIRDTLSDLERRIDGGRSNSNETSRPPGSIRFGPRELVRALNVQDEVLREIEDGFEATGNRWQRYWKAVGARKDWLQRKRQIEDAVKLYWVQATSRERQALKDILSAENPPGRRLPELPSVSPDAIAFEIKWKGEFEKWIRENEDPSPEALVKDSVIRENEARRTLSALDKVDPLLFGAIGSLSFFTMVWGGLTNMGKTPTDIDWYVPFTNINVDQMIRDGWTSFGTKIGSAVFAGYGLSWWVKNLATGKKRREALKNTPDLRQGDWDVLRRIMLTSVGSKANPVRDAGDSTSENSVPISRSDLILAAARDARGKLPKSEAIFSGAKLCRRALENVRALRPLPEAPKLEMPK